MRDHTRETNPINKLSFTERALQTALGKIPNIEMSQNNWTSRIATNEIPHPHERTLTPIHKTYHHRSNDTKALPRRSIYNTISIILSIT